MRANEFIIENIQVGDGFDFELSDQCCLSSYVAGVHGEIIIVEADDVMLNVLSEHGLVTDRGSELDETVVTPASVGDEQASQTLDIYGSVSLAESSNDPVAVDSTSPISGRQKYLSKEMSEAEYQGRKVPLGKPMKGDVKKSKVYVRKPNGKVVKVNFGDPDMRIKKSNPKRRKSFRARHNCANPGPRWKARYWSCRMW